MRFLQNEKWFDELSPEEWCQTVGVIADNIEPPHDPVGAIKNVLSGKNVTHFTLPLVEKATKEVAGYVHCTHEKENQKLTISHLKDGKSAE